jgi:hypothetical protein
MTTSPVRKNYELNIVQHAVKKKFPLRIYEVFISLAESTGKQHDS